MGTPVELREKLVETLALDLIGPAAGHPLADEVLTSAPSRWYLTGFLIPTGASASQKSDEDADEELDQPGSGAAGGQGDDDDEPDRPAARKAFFPSSIGVSVLVPKAQQTIEVEATWGDYAPQEVADGQSSRVVHWKRAQRSSKVDIDLQVKGSRRVELPDAPGLQIAWTVRPLRDGLAELAPGTKSVSVFLVNRREPMPDEQRDQSFVFQAAVTVRCSGGFVPRPNLRGLTSTDPDEQIADLQFRDAHEMAVGHGISTRAVVSGGVCREVATTWIPRADVEKVIAGTVPGVDLGMDGLAACETAAAVREKIGGLVTSYGSWLEGQENFSPSPFPLPRGERVLVAAELLKRAGVAKRRMEDGLACLERPNVLKAFRLANGAMAAAARQRGLQQSPPKQETPIWRPFQIAFLLMNLRGICEPGHADREVVDLLFFPTGGGKTEAYLGLAAFTLVLRRLENPGVASAGLSVLMRYTLRLLTLDQLGRAATLVFALELERRKDVASLGPWPFEIGLWVGKAATPNKMGKKGDKDRESARAKTIAYKNDDKKPLPIPIENCPWCGTKFTTSSFSLVPTPDHPTDLRIVCVGRGCAFHSKPLPLLAVDEPIYRRLPCFMIATLDKFAALPWVGRVGALFGKVDRHDDEGFYGPCDPNRGTKLERQLLPPDLIIQDELHLISGPLGTMAGLYETAIDALGEREVGGKKIRAKIVASTATVRRAQAQIQALFGRRTVDVFPPPGPDRRDSFFAKTVPASERPARRYLGVAAPGRSQKVAMLRTYLVLLSAAQNLYEAEGGIRAVPNPADPYMTLLGYFNSLRELGGARRIIEDEVLTKLESYGSRRLRVGQTTAQSAFANRRISFDVVELTSREPTSKVAEAKRRLGLALGEKEHVDVAIATNMISVGLDITRLGLMVVLGQPKMTAEYIQATSRVGRDEDRPGLVVTLLNVHRPRDRSHYERFEAYHESFYRAVEATSVTPFSPRAIDRGLAAVTVGLARQGLAALTPPLAAERIDELRGMVGFVPDAMAARAEAQAKGEGAVELRDKVRARTNTLLDDWASIAAENRKTQTGLQYQQEEGGAPPLLFAPLDPELAKKGRKEQQFKANRSLRDVEPSVNLFVKRLDGSDVEADFEENG